jgi:hypothetical protein
MVLSRVLSGAHQLLRDNASLSQCNAQGLLQRQSQTSSYELLVARQTETHSVWLFCRIQARHNLTFYSSSTNSADDKYMKPLVALVLVSDGCQESRTFSASVGMA